MPGAKWTVTDIATCVKMIEAGHTYEDISSRIGRTPDSIYRKMKRHGLPMVKGEQVPVPKQDVSKVMEMHRMGYTYAEIAIKTNRTRNSVAGIVYRNRQLKSAPEGVMLPSPDGAREKIMALYNSGWSIPKIARIMNTTVGSVGWYIYGKDKSE